MKLTHRPLADCSGTRLTYHGASALGVYSYKLNYATMYNLYYSMHCIQLEIPFINTFEHVFKSIRTKLK